MFKITKRSNISKARVGALETAHGKLVTPFFMPDATRAVVKHLSINDLHRLNMPAMVVNTFHLYLQPGTKIISKFGGVHEFMNFNKPLLSDSGGFQVFSLAHKSKNMGKIIAEENKVEFKSPLDGSKHVLTPKESMRIQFELGTDMIVCFDDCPPNDFEKEGIEVAVSNTIRWARMCKEEYEKQIIKRKYSTNRPLLFGVVQGGVFPEMRKRCAKALIEIGFDGYGFGARPVDKDGRFLGRILEVTADAIPDRSPRFGLGIGQPEDIVRSVLLGWDMFDCVIPTREGRHGRLFRFADSSTGLNHGNIDSFYKTINIINSKFKKDTSPINETSKLAELREYSLSYLHHLFKVKEPLAQRLATLNNLEFFLDLMENIRQSIRSDDL